jgi:hypothetical protein
MQALDHGVRIVQVILKYRDIGSTAEHGPISVLKRLLPIAFPASSSSFCRRPVTKT